MIELSTMNILAAGAGALIAAYAILGVLILLGVYALVRIGVLAKRTAPKPEKDCANCDKLREKGEQIVALEENQSEYLSALYLRAPASARRTVSYLKNLVFRILQKLNALIKNNAYVPAFRNANIPCSALVGAILNTQISIFVLYDRLDIPYADLSEILSLENRKAALLALL